MAGYDYRTRSQQREKQAQAFWERNRAAEYWEGRARLLESNLEDLLEELRKVVSPGTAAALVLARHRVPADGEPEAVAVDPAMELAREVRRFHDSPVWLDRHTGRGKFRAVKQ